jgi:hypothetical protein
MADDLVGQHPRVPSLGQAAQAVITTRGFVQAQHGITSYPDGQGGVIGR